MLKAKKFNFEDSNLANFGTPMEKQVKHDAAEKEAAWKTAGLKVGLQIWRIEKFHVVAWPEAQYGQFYSGDCYIILRTYKKTPDSEKFSFDAHFWIGEHASQDEYGTAAYKTVELDDHLNSAAVQHREVQGAETDLFLSYFPKLRILEGGMDSGFHHVDPKDYKPRLLHVQGKKHVVVRQVALEHESLNSADVFVLDHGLQLYQMNGKDCGGLERAKAAEFGAQIQNERPGAQINVFDETDHLDPAAVKFWEYLGGKKEITKSGAAPPPANLPKRLFKLEKAGTAVKMTEADDVSLEALENKDVFVLDGGAHVFIWVGKNAPKEEKAQAMGYATHYLFENNRPKNLPISVVNEGHETDAFLKSFD